MRILCLLLILSALFPAFAGGTAEIDSDTRIVEDVWNREVEIPSEVDSIIAIGSMGPRMAAYLDVIDMLVGAEDSDKAAVSARYDYSPAYHEELASLPSVGRGGGSGENNAYAEEIIMLRPDVIIAGFDAAACEELERQTGIPVISIRYRTQGFIDEGFYRSMRIFASVVGAEKRCEEVLSYIDECKADLRTRTDGVPAEDKPRAYTGAVTFNGRHGFAFTYVSFPPFDAINALNVADTLLEEQVGEAVSQARESGTAYIGNDGFEVDPEMVMEWDPDIIFLDPGNMDLVNAEYENTISDTIRITSSLHDILTMLSSCKEIKFDTGSIFYNEFTVQLKFLVFRAFDKAIYSREDPIIVEAVRRCFPKEFACAERISQLIYERCGTRLPKEELAYLAASIRRTCRDN